MYEQAPDEAQLAAFGLKLSDFADEAVEVWPENWLAVCLFADLSTQWRMGMGGPVGLDYAAVRAVFAVRGVSDEDASALFDDIRVMEAAALAEMYRGDQ